MDNRCKPVRLPSKACRVADATHPEFRVQERAGMSAAEAATFVRELRETFGRLDALPMPTVACIDG